MRDIAILHDLLKLLVLQTRGVRSIITRPYV